jgi:polar amino acid transport system substrate-binding protein
MRLFGLPLIFLLMSTAPVLAAQPASSMRVVFPYIPLMAETQETGLFIRLFQEVAQRSETEISIDILPVRRAIQSFKAGKYDALGAFPSLAEIPISLASVPYYRRENLIFYRTGRFEKGRIETLPDLDGLRVGLSAYHYPSYVTDRQQLIFERVPNDETLLRMISSDRIDAAIIERYSGRYVQRTLGLENTVTETGTAVTTENVLALFRADRGGIEHRRIFNLALYDMLCDGTLTAIFGRASLLPDQTWIERDLPPSAINPDCRPNTTALMP